MNTGDMYYGVQKVNPSASHNIITTEALAVRTTTPQFFIYASVRVTSDSVILNLAEEKHFITVSMNRQPLNSIIT